MKFGLHLGTRGVAAEPENLKKIARKADEVGLSHLGFSDHIVFTKTNESTYPYSKSGKHPVAAIGYCLDQLTCMTFAAAVTERIRLLSSVMVVPHRPPILTAKILSSIDVLSRGRTTLGIGVGWLAEEMAALGSPPFDKRGAASDEYIAAFRTLWRDAEPQMAGAHVAFKDVVFEPKPAQAGGVPVWVGGEGKAARRRAVRLGDAWYPTIRNPREPLGTPDKFKVALDDVHAMAEAAGRDPGTLDCIIFAQGYSLGKAVKEDDGSRVTFTGSAEEIAGDARAYAEAGTSEVILSFESNDLAETLDRIEGLAKDVAPLVRAA